MNRSLSVLFVSALLSQTATAGEIYTYCDPIAIQDPTGPVRAEAQLTLQWKGMAKNGALTSDGAESRFTVARADEAASGLKQLEIAVLKRVIFDQRSFETEGGSIKETTATYRIRVTSDQHLIGTEVEEGDMMMQSKSQTAVVVCRESDVTRW